MANAICLQYGNITIEREISGEEQKKDFSKAPALVTISHRAHSLNTTETLGKIAG